MGCRHPCRQNFQLEAVAHHLAGAGAGAATLLHRHARRRAGRWRRRYPADPACQHALADMLANRWEELGGALSTVRQKEGYDLALLMVTDIMQETTHLLHAGRPVSLLRRAFGEESTDTTFILPGTMSRKKQVVPPLVEAARAEEQI